MIKKLAVPARMGKVFASAFLALAFFISFHVDAFAAEVMLDKSTVTVSGMAEGKYVYTRTLYVPDKVGVYAQNYDGVLDPSLLDIDLYYVVGDTKYWVTGWTLGYGDVVNTRFYPSKGSGYYVLEVSCQYNTTYNYDCDGTATLSSWDVQ